MRGTKRRFEERPEYEVSVSRKCLKKHVETALVQIASLEGNTRSQRSAEFERPAGLETQTDSGISKHNARAREAQRLWLQNLQSICSSQPRFFSTSSSKLSRLSRVWGNGEQYEGVNATADNCLGLWKIHDVFWKPKEQWNLSQGSDEFRRLSNTVSQFLRLCISRGVCRRNDAYQMDALFGTVAVLEVVQRFVDFHVECFSPRTVQRKARHLKKVCMLASGLARSMSRSASLERVSRYLDDVISAYLRKTGAKRPPQKVKPTNSLHLLKTCFRLAHADLNDMIAQYNSESGRDPEYSSLALANFVSKWTCTFVAYVVIGSGGQNPLTISEMEVPGDEELEGILENAATAGSVQFESLRGRRAAALGLPMVSLTAKSARFIRFQVKVILPIISSLTHEVQLTGTSRPLLVSTRSGMRMRPWQVSYEFHKYADQRCPEMSSVSLSSLKRSAMSVFLKGFRENELFHGHTEGQVLDVLARHLNTTSTQVKKCVGVRGSAEHKAIASELARCLEKI